MPVKVPVYLDNMRATRVDPLVIEEMVKYMKEIYAAPGGEFGHSMEEEATEALERARQKIARKIGAKPEEIVFTSGRVESNNLAIKGAVLASGKKGKIISSKIEESSVLRSLERLGKMGFSTYLVPVDSEGFVLQDKLEEMLSGAVLGSIQFVNPEIGTIQDLKAIGDLFEEKGVIFHSDASWGFCKVDIDVRKVNVDLLTLSSGLIHGPKGVGALYVREGVKIQPLLDGAPREFGLRPGMEDVPSIVGFAKAVELLTDEHISRMKKLRDKLMELLLEIPDTKLNGPRGDKRVCNNVNISFLGVEGESILLKASMKGLLLNTGSACYSRELLPSHVILAIGGTFEQSHGSVTLGLSKWTTEEEIFFARDVLDEIVREMRSISPLYRRS
ncbi:MAG TPA: cysteine desulfurase [Candidatus Korarchaeota archaeon]|nr:cysteine desulfurase [Candidatus Korarchaeota archaeon]